MKLTEPVIVARKVLPAKRRAAGRRIAANIRRLQRIRLVADGERPLVPFVDNPHNAAPLLDDELRRDGIEFPTLDPTTGQTFMSRMRFARLKYLATKSKGLVMEGVELVKQILASPGAVFEGLKREKDE